MRLLRVRDRCCRRPWLRRNEVLAEELGDLRAGGGDRRFGERRRVGAHVGDVARFVEALSDAHRRLRGEAELPARLLLERRRAERRGRLAAVRPLVDGTDGERRVGERSPRARARASSSWTTPLSRSSPVVGSKSLPCATRAPSSETSRASNAPGSNVARRSQYSAERNAMRSRSRCTTRRVATDCTRPAESPRVTFFHSTGDTS